MDAPGANRPLDYQGLHQQTHAAAPSVFHTQLQQQMLDMGVPGAMPMVVDSTGMPFPFPLPDDPYQRACALHTQLQQQMLALGVPEAVPGTAPVLYSGGKPIRLPPPQSSSYQEACALHTQLQQQMLALGVPEAMPGTAPVLYSGGVPIRLPPPESRQQAVSVLNTQMQHRRATHAVRRTTQRPTDEYFAGLPKRKHVSKVQPSAPAASHVNQDAADEASTHGPADDNDDGGAVDQGDAGNGSSIPVQPALPAARPPTGARPRKKRRRTAKAHEAWAAIMPQLLELYLCRHGVLTVCGQFPSLAHASAAEVLQLRAQLVAPHLPCPNCGSFGLLPDDPTTSSSPISYCSLAGWVEVGRPVCTCQSCSHTHSISPVLLGCFPATPVQQCTWFDEGVLEAARAIKRHGSYSILGVSRVIQDLQAFHSHSRPGEAKYRDVRTLNQALTAYSLLQLQLDRCTFAPDVPECAAVDQPAGMSACPACSTTCLAICGDACYGMRSFDKTAKESKGMCPLTKNSPFISDSRMAQELASRQQAGRGGACDTPACSDFRADDAQGTSRRVSHYDKTGVAAFLCRHGFVLRACNMTTPENFTYYEEMLTDIVEGHFNKGCQLKFIFVDVACRMEGMLNRVVSAARVPPDSGIQELQLLVGPWHIYAHQASCQLLYNARLMAGTGRTFGDLPEHLWASLRKHSGPMAYMGDAAREDVMCILLLERDNKKVLELPCHLDKVHARTHAQALQLLRVELGGVAPSATLPSPCEVARQARANHQPSEQSQVPSRRKLSEFKLVNALETQYLHRGVRAAPTPFTSPVSGTAQPARMGPQRLQLTRELQQLQAQIEKLRADTALLQLQYGDVRYWEICAEAKAYNISRLQQEIEAALTRYNTLALAVSRGTDAAGRHERRRLRHQKTKAKTKVMHLVDQLVEQHSFYGQGQHSYEPLALKDQLQGWLADALPGGTFHLPWSCPTARLDKAQHDQQGYLRCVEEVQILEREARDTISYHERHIQMVDAQLQLTQESIQLLQESTLDAPVEAVRVLGSIHASYGGQAPILTPGCTSARQRAITVLHGCKRLLTRRRAWLDMRVDDAREALGRMQLRASLPVDGAGQVPDVASQAEGSDDESLDSEGLPRIPLEEAAGLFGSDWEQGSDELDFLLHSSSEGQDDV